MTAKIPFEFLASGLLRKRDTKGTKEERGRRTGFWVNAENHRSITKSNFFCQGKNGRKFPIAEVRLYDVFMPSPPPPPQNV